MEDLPRVEGVPEASYAALAGRYGYAAREVLALAPPSAASWPSRSSPACPTCWPRSRSPPAASRRASIGDVLLRRTRLGLLAARELPVERVADVLARELDWSPERTAREVERFAEEADAEGIRAEAEPVGRRDRGSDPSGRSSVPASARPRARGEHGRRETGAV